MSYADAVNFYHWAQQHDEWAGENYEGSSVLGAMEALKAHLYIHEYWWAEDVDQMRHAIYQFGPVELGSWWYTGMFDIDSEGFVNLTGKVEGGHAHCLGGYDTRRDAFRIDQSWNPDWGWNGSAWLRAADAQQLLGASGECALPRKNRPNTRVI